MVDHLLNYLRTVEKLQRNYNQPKNDMNLSNAWIRTWWDETETPAEQIEWCVVTITETETVVISKWRKKSEHELNMDRLSDMCHESWLKQIKRG